MIDLKSEYSQEFLEKLPTPRLLNIHRKMRSFMCGCICSCGCGEVLPDDEKAFEFYKHERNRVKAILDTRENVRKK